MMDTNEDDLNWYLSLSGSDASSVDRDKQMAMAIIQEVYRLTQRYDKEKFEDVSKRFEALYGRFK
jgi:hypothetical protein